MFTTDPQAQSDTRLLLNQTVVLYLYETLEETWMKKCMLHFFRKQRSYV